MSNELKLGKDRITHDHRCENCGDPATVNYQLAWVSWTVKPDGDFKNMELHNCGTNEFWCDRCWNLDRKEGRVELKMIRDEYNAKVSKL